MGIINKDLSLNTRFFEINGNSYEIIGTAKGVDNQVYNSIDTVRNNTNKNIKKMRRADLNIMLKKFNAK